MVWVYPDVFTAVMDSRRSRCVSKHMDPMHNDYRETNKYWEDDNSLVLIGRARRAQCNFCDKMVGRISSTLQLLAW